MKNQIYNLDKEIFVSEYDMETHLIESGDNYYHTHSYYEIFYVIKGEIDHYLNGTVSRLKAGDILFLRPFDLHCFLRQSGNTALHRDIMISTKLWKKACDYLDEDLYDIINTEPQPFSSVLSINNIQNFEKQLTSIVNSYEHIQYSKRLTNSLLIELLMLFVHTHIESNENSNYPAALNAILAKLHKPDNFKLPLPEILSQFNYTQSYLCRLFKSNLGVTMTDYLNSQRLNYAILLLQRSDSSIEQIATACGFTNLSYFNRIFKNKYQLTPSEFRKKSITPSS